MTDQMFFDRKAAAKMAGVSVDLILREIKAGRLQARRSSQNEEGDPVGKYLISRAALEEWYERLESA